MSGRDRYNWSKIDPYLKENYVKESANEIGKLFNMKPTQIRDRARLLGIKKQPKFNWKPEHKEYVLNNYSNLGARLIADKFNIPISRVNKMAQTLGVKYIPKDAYICSQGYKIVGKSGNRKSEHRLVYENYLGRPLNSNEIIHHKDGNKLNNDLSNLELTPSKEHIEEHRQLLNESRNNI